ncbi:MAG: DUF2846 domain-containing protein [Akkermansiaceae bacterium]|nr:DUF2846 domain-containing protein [Akkermansiaceae bacterium]
MKNLLIAASISLLAILTSCTTGSTATPSPRDPRLATVTVMRKSSLYGAAVKIDVLLDANKIARIGSGDRVEFQVPPGQHFISVPFREMFGSSERVVGFHAEAGKKYYVHFSASMGGDWITLKQLSPEEGEGEIASHKYRLIDL